jgi:two-component system phosphate regulon response regulator PhoB
VVEEKILVVEDEQDIAELIEYNLLKHGFSVHLSSSGEEALEAVIRESPDLVILDLMLPGLDGLGVCSRLRQGPETRKTPIVIVTAKGEEDDIVRGLEAGADDYIVKPFSPKVLVARVRSILRRRSEVVPRGKEVVRLGRIEIHPGRREVRVEGGKVDLTYTEFNILHHLARHPGWVFTRQQIFNAVRGDHYNVTERSVDVHVRSLRRKLGGEAQRLETVRGVGYRFRG